MEREEAGAGRRRSAGAGRGTLEIWARKVGLATEVFSGGLLRGCVRCWAAPKESEKEDSVGC
jgi:hypothetical protein